MTQEIPTSQSQSPRNRRSFSSTWRAPGDLVSASQCIESVCHKKQRLRLWQHPSKARKLRDTYFGLQLRGKGKLHNQHAFERFLPSDTDFAKLVPRFSLKLVVHIAPQGDRHPDESHKVCCKWLNHRVSRATIWAVGVNLPTESP